MPAAGGVGVWAAAGGVGVLSAAGDSATFWSGWSPLSQPANAVAMRSAVIKKRIRARGVV